MDQQRLERALRGGPPFATRYVSRPLTLDESLGGRRGAGVGRLVLLVAVTALLLAGMLGGLAALGGLLDDAPGPLREDAGVIPGLDGQAFMAAFEATGERSDCGEPQPATGTLLQWTCRDVGDGNRYDEGVILVGESVSAIHSIEAWVALADGVGRVDADHAGGLFAFVAETAEFTGADIAAARAWALEGGGRNGQIEISGVTYRLSGPAERRVLKIAMSPACFLTTECPPESGVAIDTSAWVPFVSERYGYVIAHPPAWTVTPATRAWAFHIDHESRECCDSTGSDQFRDPKRAPTTAGVYPIHLTVFAVDAPASTSEDGWIADYYAGRPWMAPGFCEYEDAERQPISVDGQPGTMIVGDTDCGDAAFVFVDGRVHVFELEAYDRPALMPEWRTLKTALLEALLGTVEFQP